MQVLVTRPADAAARTVEALAGRGHHAIVSSVLDIVATDAAWPQGVVDAAMATSAHAFTHLRADPDWPLPETRRLLPLYLVGEKTLEAARARGFDGPAIVALDAQDLATQILAQANRPARTLYLAGLARKSELEDRLAAADVRFDVLEIYDARAATALSEDAIERLIAGRCEAVLHYSRRSAEIFLKLAAAAEVNVAALLHVAISEDAAAPLRGAELPRVAVAAEPKEQSLLDLLAAAAMLPSGLGKAAL
jgi:uroporphyrinogen-III synthase